MYFSDRCRWTSLNTPLELLMFIKDRRTKLLCMWLLVPIAVTWVISEPSIFKTKLRVVCSCIFFAQKISKIRTSVINLEGEDNPSPDFLVLFSLDIYGIIICKNHGMTIWNCCIAVVALFLILNYKFARCLTNEYLGSHSCKWEENSYVFPFPKN